MSVEAAIMEGQLITNALPEVYINVVISAMVRVLHLSLFM